MRKFKAYAIRTDDETGLGVEEYNEAITLSIASIYLPYKPSRKDVFDVVARYIMDGVKTDEQILLRVVNPIRAKYQWIIRYEGLYVREEGHFRVPFTQTKELAEDALKRKGTIVEELAEGYHYESVILPKKGADHIVF